MLDDASYNGDLAATSGTAAFTSPNVTWTGNVPAGGTVTVTYSVTVNPAAGSGDDLLTGHAHLALARRATARPAAPTRAARPRSPCRSWRSPCRPAPTSVKPGQTFQLTTVFTNTGQTPLPGHPRLDPDRRPPRRRATADRRDDAHLGDAVGPRVLDPIWTVGDTPSAAASRWPSPFHGQPAADREPADPRPGWCPPRRGRTAGGRGADPACAIDVPVLLPQLTIAKTADRATAQPGDVVAYTIRDREHRRDALHGRRLSPTRWSAPLDDAVYGADAAATTGSVAFADAGADLDRRPGGRGVIGDGDLHDDRAVARPGRQDRPTPG